jgi:predicted dehydrogenase
VPSDHYFYHVDNVDSTVMQSRARIGVIGAGWWATSYHLPALVDHPRADVVAVVDADGRKAEEAAHRNGIPLWFTDHGRLLEGGVDGVVVATPHDTHFTLARDALEAGADVLVEKPMVIAPQHGRELVRLAHERGRRLHVGYPFPYTRHAQLLRELVGEGRLGTLLTATGLFATSALPLYRGAVDSSMHVSEGTLWPTGRETYSSPTRGGGQLLTQVTHCASLLLFLSGLKPLSVFCHSDCYDTSVDVWDGIVFKAAGGAVGTITSTGTVADHKQRVEEYRLFGSEGQAMLDTHAGTLRIELYDERRTIEPARLQPDEVYPAHAPATRLVDAIVDDAPVVATGELGLLTVELLAAASVSSQTAAPVRLELDEALVTTASEGNP